MSAEGRAIIATLRRHRDCFDHTKNGLGDAVTNAGAEGIDRAMQSEVDAEGTPWAALEPRYAATKSKKFPGKKIGQREGILEDFENLKGTAEITEDHVTQTYGVSAQAEDEADWFQSGDQAQNRPERGFYGFNPIAKALVTDIYDRRFAQATS